MISQNPRITTDGADLPALRRAGKQDSPEALRAAAQQFESLFMNMMMKSMRDATPQDSPFDSQQSRMYPSMLDTKIINNFACAMNGKPVFEAKLEPAISANPYLSFFVRVDGPSTLELVWTDDDKQSYKAEAKIAVA